MIDLNDASTLPPRFDLDAIAARLRDTAAVWVPQHFPNGRRDGDEWRLANIRGDAPRKNGSCVIALKGECAGGWIDFDGGDGGGPLSTLAEATGYTGHQLFAYAAELAGEAPSAARPRKKALRHSSDDVAREISFSLSGAHPIAGTHAEAYLAARGLGPPPSPDLLFHDDLAHWEAKRGYPGMVAVVRDAGGAQIALHRTYLDPKMPAKADVTPARKTLGPVGGGAVRLAEPQDGLIALTEGIETALAVMSACPDLPAWATLSATGMEGIVLPPGITRVVLLADHDEAGRRAAEATAAKLATEGRQVSIALPPRDGDDFNDLLLRDGPEAVRAAINAAVAWGGDDTVPANDEGAQPLEMAPVIGATAPEPDEVGRTAATYPLPFIEGVELRYFRTRKGDVLVHRNAGKDKDGHTIWRVVASPFGIPARLRYLDQEGTYGRALSTCRAPGSPARVRRRSAPPSSPRACAPMAMATRLRWRCSRRPIRGTRSSSSAGPAGTGSMAATIRSS